MVNLLVLIGLELKTQLQEGLRKSFQSTINLSLNTQIHLCSANRRVVSYLQMFLVSETPQ